MAEFYLWTQTVTYLVTLMFALCVLSQTLTTVLSFHRFPRSRARIFETLLELFILGNVFVCSLLHGETREAYLIGILAPTGYGDARIVMFSVIVILAAVVFALTGKPWPLLAILAAGLTLPIMERLTGNTFAYIYIASMLFWLARSIPVSFLRFREIRTGISVLSVKHLIDSLRTGVMFCEKDGFVLLSNTRMQRLMTEITGQVSRNGKKFFEMLSPDKIDPRCRITQFESQNVIILPDSSAWMFTMTELPMGRKTYLQLTATDISERWKLTAELQDQNSELTRRQEELKRTIADLHTISRERQTQIAKMRSHDVLSERIALLRQAVLNEQTPDYSLLRSISEGLKVTLKPDGSALPPQNELDIMKQTFASIGVEIQFDGNLPEETAIGQLFADVAREAIANAVRHGLATQVHIHMEDSDGVVRMAITDNGHPGNDTIREGGGISGMRRRLSELNGELAIKATPGFALTVTIPGRKG